MLKIRIYEPDAIFHKLFTIGSRNRAGFGLMRYPFVICGGNHKAVERPDFWPALGMVGFFGPYPELGYRAFQVRFLWFTFAVKLPYPLTERRRHD